MPHRYDGGQAALAGYLYQMVGALGLKAWAHCEGIGQESPELSAILTVVCQTDLYHELWGQDAVLLASLGLRPDDQCVLIQYKYSRSPESHSMTSGDLKEIAQSFRNSANLAHSSGHHVTGYVLVTNRRPSPNAQRATSVSSDDIVVNLRRVTIQLPDWFAKLDSFSKQHGCTDDESAQGIDRLIGQLVRQAGVGAGVPVTVRDLVDAFTGCAEASKLTVESVAKQAVALLEGIRPSLGLMGTVPVHRRSLLDDISNSVAENALVVVAGTGGCGKSVSLWQWALRRTSTPSVQSGSLAALSAANLLPNSWLSQLISGWANLPPQHPRRTENADLALERLGFANQDLEMPILYLGLDGLDENIDRLEREDLIRQLIDWFWQEDQCAKFHHRRHRASLVVTVRDLAEIPEKWLRKISSGFSYEGPSPCTIIADIFTDEELITAARQALPESLSSRVVATVTPQIGFSNRLLLSSSLPQIVGVDNPLASPARSEIVEALQHPAMWGAFLRLREDAQSLVLDGSPLGLQELVAEFSRWFSSKAAARSPLRKADLIIEVLCAIAVHCVQAMKSEFTDSDWIEPASRTGLVEIHTARLLKSEALSAGLINGTLTGQWHWRHAFVCEYLVRPFSGSKGEGN